MSKMSRSHEVGKTPLIEHELGTIKVEAQFRGKHNQRIESLSDVKDRYQSLASKQKEHLYAVFLNSDNKEIGDKLIGLGGNSSTGADTQDVVRTAALVNASAVILVHNHPSGNNQPTQQDIEVTREAREVLEKINVELLDHVIISKDSHYSMRQVNHGPF